MDCLFFLPFCLIENKKKSFVLKIIYSIAKKTETKIL